MNFVAIAHVWNQAPLVTSLLDPAADTLQSDARKPASRGAHRWRRQRLRQRFSSITLPWLPADAAACQMLILTSINSIMAFDLFWTITHGGPGSATTVFSLEMGYAYAFQFFRFGEGAAILYVLTIVCLILAWFYLKLFFHSEPRGRKRAGRETDVGSDPTVASPWRGESIDAGFSSALSHIFLQLRHAPGSPGRTRRTVAGLGACGRLLRC